MNFFKELDFISTEPRFYVNSRIRFKNWTGAILSLIIMILTAASIIFFIYEYYDKRKLKVIYNEDINEKPEVSLNKYPFVFRAMNVNGTTYKNPEKILSFSMNYINVNYSNGKPESKIIPMNLIKCNQTTYDYLYSGLKDFENLKNENNCLDTNLNLTLKGIINNPIDIVKYLTVSIKRCENTTSNIQNPCYARDTIDSLISKSYMILYLIDFNINNNYITEPNIPYFKGLSYAMSTTLIKQVFVSFRNNNYQINHGLFIDDLETFNFFTQNEIDIQYIIMDNSITNGNFLHFNFSNSRIKNFYFITYEKIVNYLANIGAIWNILIFIGKYIDKFIIADFYFLYICSYLNKAYDEKCHHLQWKHNDHENIFENLSKNKIDFKSVVNNKTKYNPQNNNKNISKYNDDIQFYRVNIEKKLLSNSNNNIKNIHLENESEVIINPKFPNEIKTNTPNPSSKIQNRNKNENLNYISSDLGLITSNPNLDKENQQEEDEKGNKEIVNFENIKNKGKSVNIENIDNAELNTNIKFDVLKKSIIPDNNFSSDPEYPKNMLNVNNTKCNQQLNENKFVETEFKMHKNINNFNNQNTNFYRTKEFNENFTTKKNLIQMNFNHKAKKIRRESAKTIKAYLIKKMSIEEIVRKTIEIDKIKFMIFDKEYLELLKNFPTLISLETCGLNKFDLKDNQEKSFKKDTFYCNNSNQPINISDIRQFWELYEFN